MSAGPMLTGEYDMVRLTAARAVHGGEYKRLVLLREGQWLQVNAWPGTYRGQCC